MNVIKMQLECLNSYLRGLGVTGPVGVTIPFWHS